VGGGVVVGECGRGERGEKAVKGMGKMHGGRE